MRNKVYRVGVDTRNMFNVFPEIEPDVIVTSPTPGNDFLIEPTLPRENEIIVVMDKDISPSEFLYHSQLLGRGRIDTVLLTPDTTHLEDYIFLKEQTNNIGRLGIYLPESTNLGKQILGIIDCVGIEIGPLNFDLELIEKCEEYGQEIIGFCDLRKYEYPDAYNLSFYGRYCHTLILNYNERYESRVGYIKDLIDKEGFNEVELDKTVKKDGNIKIGMSIKLRDDLIIPYTDLDVIASPEEVMFSIGRDYELVPKDIIARDKLEEAVDNFWEALEGKEKMSREEKIDTLRYVITSFIDTGYNIGRISRYALVFIVKRGKTIFDNYLLYVSENGEIFFRNLKNTLKIDSESY